MSLEKYDGEEQARINYDKLPIYPYGVMDRSKVLNDREPCIIWT